jgi:hypothetical protein
MRSFLGVVRTDYTIIGRDRTDMSVTIGDIPDKDRMESIVNLTNPLLGARIPFDVGLGSGFKVQISLSKRPNMDSHVFDLKLDVKEEYVTER